MTSSVGRKPRIGILGIMQDLYDEMIPGIAQRQEGYAAELAAHLSDVADFTPSKAIKYREDAERAMREFENADLDGALVVMLTYDWKSASFRADVGRWARAAAAATAWKRLKVAIFGYAMNEMGDIRVDESALVRTLGPAIISVAQGDLWRGMLQAPAEEVAAVIAFEDENFEIDPRLSWQERTDHARMQVAIEQ